MMLLRQSMEHMQMTSLPYKEKLVTFLHSPVFKCLACLCFLLGVCLMLPPFQTALLVLGDRLAGKQLSEALWKGRFIEWGGKLILPSFLLFSFLIRNWLGEPQRRQFDRFFLCFVFLAWLVFCGASVLLHEPWRDEVQAWLIAQFNSPAGIFYEMRNEGHFVPWFYLLFPFAKLGFPTLTLNLISYIIMGGCVVFFLLKAPFNMYAKAAFVFTVPMAYYYPVISRCYCIFAFCVFAIAFLFKQRTSHPFCYAILIGLLANSHSYAEGLVAVLTADAFFVDILLPWKELESHERKRRLLALIVVIAFVLFAFCQVAPAFGSSSLVHSGHALSIENLFDVCIEIFLALDLSSFSQFLILFFILVGLHYLAWIRKGELLLILELSVLWMILFAILLYGASIPSRAWMWFFVFVLVLWQLEPKAGSILLLLFSIAAFNPSVNVKDWNHAFSTAGLTASYMKANIDHKESIYLPCAHENYALVFFAPDYEYKSFETGQSTKLFSWDKDFKNAQEKDINSYIKDRFEETGASSIIIVGLNNILKDGYDSILYAFDVLLAPSPSIASESYSILRVYDRSRP